MICGYRPATGWKLFVATDLGNIKFASTSSCVSLDELRELTPVLIVRSESRGHGRWKRETLSTDGLINCWAPVCSTAWLSMI